MVASLMAPRLTEVLARAIDAPNRRNSTFTEEQVTESLKTAFVHIEVISGNVREKLVRLAGARNTSNQVKEFALENLGGGFDWLKEVIKHSSLAGRIRYRDNDPEDVDVRTVLALLTMFHHKWTEDGKDPLVAYTSKGGILKYYRDPEWLPGYQALNPVVVDILRLYDYIHEEFVTQYQSTISRRTTQEVNSESGAKLSTKAARRLNCRLQAARRSTWYRMGGSIRCLPRSACFLRALPTSRSNGPRIRSSTLTTMDQSWSASSWNSRKLSATIPRQWGRAVRYGLTSVRLLNSSG